MVMEEHNKGVSWSLAEAIVIILVVVGVNFFLPFKQLIWFQELGRVTSPTNPLLGQVFWAGLFQGGLLIGLVIYSLKFKHRESLSNLGLVPDEKRLWWWIGLKQGVLIFFLLVLVGMLITFIYPFELEPQPIATVIMSAKTWREMLLPLAVASLMAPISEEIYFRGFLYPALRNRLGRKLALIIASSFFGIMHFDLIRFIPITLGGIWLTLLYEKTGSLYTPIMAHAVWNTIMTFILFWGANLGA